MARMVENLASFLTTLDSRLSYRGTDYAHSNVFVDYPKLERTDLQVVLREISPGGFSTHLPVKNNTVEIAIYGNLNEAQEVASNLYEQINSRIGRSFTQSDFLLVKILPNEQDCTFTGVIIGSIVRFWFSVSVFYRSL